MKGWAASCALIGLYGRRNAFRRIERPRGWSRKKVLMISAFAFYRFLCWYYDPFGHQHIYLFSFYRRRGHWYRVYIISHVYFRNCACKYSGEIDIHLSIRHRYRHLAYLFCECRNRRTVRSYVECRDRLAMDVWFRAYSFTGFYIRTGKHPRKPDGWVRKADGTKRKSFSKKLMANSRQWRK